MSISNCVIDSSLTVPICCCRSFSQEDPNHHLTCWTFSQMALHISLQLTLSPPEPHLFSPLSGTPSPAAHFNLASAPSIYQNISKSSSSSQQFFFRLQYAWPLNTCLIVLTPNLLSLWTLTLPCPTTTALVTLQTHSLPPTSERFSSSWTGFRHTSFPTCYIPPK
jgi:hypothetical protein